MMSLDPRALAQKRIHDLEQLVLAAGRMIEQEKKLADHAIPYAGKAWDRANAALLNAAFDCFECDELYDRAREIDPDFIIEDEPRVYSIDERFGLCSWIAA